MDEMENLNIDDLDVEELEHRVELASAAPSDGDGKICPLVYWEYNAAAQ